MITTKNDGWELVVFYNGMPIYKKWLQRSYSCLMSLYGPNRFFGERSEP